MPDISHIIIALVFFVVGWAARHLSLLADARPVDADDDEVLN
jgi:hypothetical protein